MDEYTRTELASANPAAKLIDVLLRGCDALWRGAIKELNGQALPERPPLRQALVRQRNLYLIARITARLLPSHVSALPIKDYWLARFVIKARDTREDHHRQAWAELLALELAVPTGAVEAIDELASSMAGDH